MATYTPPTISNYNDNPPSNDATQDVVLNGLDWNRHINEIGTPLNNYISAVNTETDAAFDKVDNKLPVNAVVDYSADNTGTADTEEEIQAAINSISGTGVVYLNPGVYNIGSSIILAPGVKLIGAGPGLTTLNATSAGITMISYVASSTQSFFNIENMTISGNNYATVQGIIIDGNDASDRCTDIRIESLYLTGGVSVEMQRGIRLDYCANITIEDVFITQTGTGVELEMCTDSDLTNIKVQNGDLYGFYLQGDGTASSSDEGVRMTNCSTNVQAYGVFANEMDFVNMSNCSLTSATSGPLIATNCKNWSLTGCEIAEAVTIVNAGLDMDQNCESWSIIGNLFVLNNWGIDLNGSYHIVQGNRLFANTANDIIVQSTCTHCIISNNICGKNGNNGVTDPTGDNIQETGSAEWNQLIHNSVSKGVTKVGGNSIVGYANTINDGDNVVF